MPGSQKIKKNALYLFLLQGSNYLFPLINLPYLVRVLGPEKFGLLAFSQVYIQYFVLLTDYGFNWTATQQIAVHREDPRKTSEIFCSVLCIKFALTLLGAFLLAITLFTVPTFKNDHAIYWASFLIVIGNLLFPIWFFQGIEKMEYITIINLIAKGICTTLIFLCVRDQGDYLVAAIVQASAFVSVGIWGLIVAIHIGKLKLSIPPISAIKESLSQGWYVFISTGAISLYTNSNIFILGLMLGPVHVGYFSGADKLVKAVQNVLSPISQATYPHISKLASQSKPKAAAFIRKNILWLGIASGALSLGIFLCAKPLVKLGLGGQYDASVSIVKWLSPIPFFVTLSNIFGIQTMLMFGLNKEFSRILLMSGIFNLCIIIPLTHFFGPTGAAVSVVCTEMMVTGIMLGEIIKRGTLKVHKSKL